MYEDDSRFNWTTVVRNSKKKRDIRKELETPASPVAAPSTLQTTSNAQQNTPDTQTELLKILLAIPDNKENYNNIPHTTTPSKPTHTTPEKLYPAFDAVLTSPTKTKVPIGAEREQHLRNIRRSLDQVDFTPFYQHKPQVPAALIRDFLSFSVPQ